MSPQLFPFSSEGDERSLSPLSLTDREEQQQVNEPAVSAPYRLLSNHRSLSPLSLIDREEQQQVNAPAVAAPYRLLSNHRREIERFPCKARGLPNTHNARSAYIDIPPDATHGTILICSHPECASSGRKFRFCTVCHLPVARRNFSERHSHGIDMIQSPQRSDSHEMARNQQEELDPRIAVVATMNDITAKRRAAELLLEDLKLQERLIYTRWGRNPPTAETNMGDNVDHHHAESCIEHSTRTMHSSGGSFPTSTGGSFGDQLLQRVEPNLYKAGNGEQLYQRVEPNLYIAGNGEQLYQRVEPNLYAGNRDQNTEPNHWDSSTFSRDEQRDTRDEQYSTSRKRHKGPDTIFRI
jgi:hypothetical protein